MASTKAKKFLHWSSLIFKRKKPTPIGYRIQEKDHEKNGIDHAFDLVAEAVAAGFPPSIVVADTWFSSADLMERLETLGCEFICQIKSNRKVKTNPSPNVEWTSLTRAFEGVQRQRVLTEWDNQKIRSRKKRRKIIADRVLKIRGRKTPVKAVAAYNRRGAKAPFAIYISSSRTRSGAMIWLLARARWRIECVFRSCKQNFSFGNLSCSGREASHLAVEVPFFLYCLLNLEFAKFGFTSSDSVDAMARQIRERITDQSIDKLIDNPMAPAVVELREKRRRLRGKTLERQAAASF